MMKKVFSASVVGMLLVDGTSGVKIQGTRAQLSEQFDKLTRSLLARGEYYDVFESYFSFQIPGCEKDEAYEAFQCVQEIGIEFGPDKVAAAEDPCKEIFEPRFVEAVKCFVESCKEITDCEDQEYFFELVAGQSEYINTEYFDEVITCDFGNICDLVNGDDDDDDNDDDDNDDDDDDDDDAVSRTGLSLATSSLVALALRRML